MTPSRSQLSSAATIADFNMYVEAGDFLDVVLLIETHFEISLCCCTLKYCVKGHYRLLLQIIIIIIRIRDEGKANTVLEFFFYENVFLGL